eukprot:9145476-Pyramimonas_sp.AAC.4
MRLPSWPELSRMKTRTMKSVVLTLNDLQLCCINIRWPHYRENKAFKKRAFLVGFPFLNPNFGLPPTHPLLLPTTVFHGVYAGLVERAPAPNNAKTGLQPNVSDACIVYPQPIRPKANLRTSLEANQLRKLYNISASSTSVLATAPCVLPPLLHALLQMAAHGRIEQAEATAEVVHRSVCEHQRRVAAAAECMQQGAQQIGAQCDM